MAQAEIEDKMSRLNHIPPRTHPDFVERVVGRSNSSSASEV
jgi:hypothetical protein